MIDMNSTKVINSEKQAKSIKKVKTKKSNITLKKRNALLGYMFISPWIVGFILLTAFPLIYSIILSLSEVNVSPTGIQTEFIGVINYFKLLREDPYFPVVLGEAVISIVLSTPMIVIAALMIALLLNTKLKGRTFFRAVFFLPVIIISGPVMSKLISNKAIDIVEPAKYIVYQFLGMLPMDAGAPILYVFDNMVLILWYSGVQVLIFLAGIQKIDTSIFEAASIDGASSWQMFWEIILPYVKPLILINVVYTIVEMSTFPGNGINSQIVNRMFEIGHVYSYSSAMSWIYFIVILLILGAAYLILRDKNSTRKMAR